MKHNLLKGWLLYVSGQFEGVHNLQSLYKELVETHNAPPLYDVNTAALVTLDQYESLRYPNRQHPTEVGNEDWPGIESFVDLVWQSMPKAIEEAIGNVVPGRKAGRVIMKKKIKR